MLHRGVLAHPADEDGILAGTFDRGDIAAILALIHHLDAGEVAQRDARLLGGDRLFEFDVHGFAVAAEHRHPHAGGGELDVRVQDLLGLHHHLPFFLGETGIQEDINVGNDVEGDLLGEASLRDRVGHEHGPGLGEQLVHRLFSGARHRLIGRDHDPLDDRQVMQRLQRQHQLGGGAVGIGDDALGNLVQRLGVHFGHHQRHAAVHAPGAGVINHDAALGGDLGRPFLGDGAAGAHQDNVGALEVVMLQRLGLEVVIAKGDIAAHRAGGGQRHHLGNGKLALRQDLQHLAPDIAGGADDGNFIGHGNPGKLPGTDTKCRGPAPLVSAPLQLDHGPAGIGAGIQAGQDGT